jgi:ABC-type nitrate/sulfonate/bicarbonate transport system substrate-binding protein
VSVALDWTPDTNHIGLYVADKLGYFKQQGIALKIIPYGSTAPETLVSSGAADFGISYQAGVAYARASGEDVESVFAQYQKGLYVIGVRADRADIASPKDLDGKIYAGFGSPDEKPELQYVIKHAGGTGNFTTVTLNTSAYDAVYSGQADFTIPEISWEVIQAKLANKPLKTFDPTKYGFPDEYSTLIASSQKYLSSHADLARRFLAAVTQGFAYAADHPTDAAKILLDANPSALPNPQLVYQSEALLTSGGYARNAKGQVGNQSSAVWTNYGNFLYSNGLLTDSNGKPLTSAPNWNDYYTNAYLPASSQ